MKSASDFDLPLMPGADRQAGRSDFETTIDHI
jgi:hypothetical protein